MIKRYFYKIQIIDTENNQTLYQNVLYDKQEAIATLRKCISLYKDTHRIKSLLKTIVLDCISISGERLSSGVVDCIGENEHKRILS